MRKVTIAPNKLLLRCLAFKRNGQWLAMCIDLDLAAQADTPAKAKKLLRDQMHSYIEDALTIDNEHASELLKRKAPIRFIALYHVIKIVHATKRMFSYEATLPVRLTHA